MNFHWLSDKAPPRHTLLLVLDENMEYRLRSRTEEGDWYDENNNLDDSGLTIEQWAELPPPKP